MDPAYESDSAAFCISSLVEFVSLPPSGFFLAISQWTKSGFCAITIDSMAQVLVRNLDDRVVAALKRKAELRGHSLEKELREILASAALLTGQERRQLSRRIRAMTPTGIPQTDSAKLIREDRDRR